MNVRRFDMRLAILLIASLSLVATPTARAADISGEWILNFNGPQGPVDATAKFTQKGEEITGTIDGPQGVLDCTGTLKETKLALQMEVNAGGQSLSIFILGDVEGDTMKGSFSVAEMRGEWTGKRKN
jgi:hypothetical protein